MKLLDRWRKKAIKWVVENISRFMIKISLKVITDFSNQHFLFVTADWYKASILLKKHDGVVECLLFSSLVDEVVTCLEDSIVLNAISKILNGSWLQFLIFDENAKAEEIKLPPSIDTEVVSNFGPVLIELIYQIKVGPYCIKHIR